MQWVVSKAYAPGPVRLSAESKNEFEPNMLNYHWFTSFKFCSLAQAGHFFLAENLHKIGLSWTCSWSTCHYPLISHYKPDTFGRDPAAVPLARLNELQDSGSWMFMIRFKCLSLQDHRWQVSSKNLIESSAKWKLVCQSTAGSVPLKMAKWLQRVSAPCWISSGPCVGHFA